jgi:hypothetical protein
LRVHLRISSAAELDIDASIIRSNAHAAEPLEFDCAGLRSDGDVPLAPANGVAPDSLVGTMRVSLGACS